MMPSFMHKPSRHTHLEQELQRLSSTLDALKDSAVQDSRQQLDALHHQVEALWQDIDLEKRGSRLMRSTCAAGRRVEACARQHPWATVAAVAGVCALAGYLLSRRS